MQIREATIDDAAGIAKVGVDTWRTAYRGIMSDEHLDGLSYDSCTDTWKSRLAAVNEFVYVATTETGEIVGYAGAGPEKDGDPNHSGELYGLYVSQEHQGKGIGKSLFDVVTHRFTCDGYGRMLLWVLSDNHSSCEFYEAIGGSILSVKTSKIGGRQLEMTSYGWCLAQKH